MNIAVWFVKHRCRISSIEQEQSIPRWQIFLFIKTEKRCKYNCIFASIAPMNLNIL